MKKTISVLLLVAMLLSLAACRKSEEIVVVPTDAERIVEVALTSPGNAVPAAGEMPESPAIEYAEEHYAFSTTAAEGKLTINADATVRYPASLQLPVARVSAVGFPQEIAKAYFDYFFAGKQPIVYNRGAAVITKQSLRDTIALYEQQIADGTILSQQQLTAEEAREEIKRLEKQIPDALDSAPPVELSDGTMLPDLWMNDDDGEPMLVLDAATEQENLYIYTPVNADDHVQAYLSYDRNIGAGFYEGFYEAEETAIASNTSIQGMTVTWNDAIQMCKDFFALGGVTDMTVSEAFQLEKNGKYAYSFRFVRSVAGVPLAINYEGAAYKGVNTPWSYENASIVIDDGGLFSATWSCPTKTTEIVNPAASVMPFSEIKDIFETMVVEFYKTESVRYDGFQWDYSVTVDNILLSMLRIRDVSTDERVGLYVPAWVFYGQCCVDDEPTVKRPLPRIVFAINALDGTVINMEQGY